MRRGYGRGCQIRHNEMDLPTEERPCKELSAPSPEAFNGVRMTTHPTGATDSLTEGP